MLPKKIFAVKYKANKKSSKKQLLAIISVIKKMKQNSKDGTSTINADNGTKQILPILEFLKQVASQAVQPQEKTTGRQLQRILDCSVKTGPQLSFRRDIDCDEVYPSIYIGDMNSAKNKFFLLHMGITHILNAAEGYTNSQVNTNENYYSDLPYIRYLGLPLTDHPSTDISIYFSIASRFIHNGIFMGGKVLVHCVVGISRSATCALAYLMINRKLSAVDAIRTVSGRRYIRPNDGFLQKLADLDNELRKERQYEN